MDEQTIHQHRGRAKGRADRRTENERAQAHQTYMIGGEHHARIAFGEEPWRDREAAICGECGARSGEYHVPGCEAEQCPVCGGRVISCDCGYGLPAYRT